MQQTRIISLQKKELGLKYIVIELVDKAGEFFIRKEKYNIYHTKVLCKEIIYDNQT